MGADFFSSHASAFKNWLEAQRREGLPAADRFPCINVRGGEIVGTDDTDLTDGTYVRIDTLPSQGGTLFSAVLGPRLDSLNANKVPK